MADRSPLTRRSCRAVPIGPDSAGTAESIRSAWLANCQTTSTPAKEAQDTQAREHRSEAAAAERHFIGQAAGCTHGTSAMGHLAVGH